MKLKRFKKLKKAYKLTVTINKRKNTEYVNILHVDLF